MLSSKFRIVEKFIDEDGGVFVHNLYNTLPKEETLITISGNDILLVVGVNYPDIINTFVLLMDDGIGRICFISKDWKVLSINRINDCYNKDLIKSYNYMIKHRNLLKTFDSFDDMVEFGKL